MAATTSQPSFGRIGSLFVVTAKTTIDLSALRFVFKSAQSERETPNNLRVRVYNLAASTKARIKAEGLRVVLQAGYQSGPAGVIFTGEIRQFGDGREDAKSTYLDILASDGDTGYQYAFMAQSFAHGTKLSDMVDASIATMAPYGVNRGQVNYDGTGGILPRGKVLFGLSRAMLRSAMQNTGATWSISNGKVNIIDLRGYLPGEAVVLNSTTGLVGRVEQTVDGMAAKCLINPKIQPGGLLKIDNKSINTTTAAKPLGGDPNAPQIPFDSYKGLQRYASIAGDGLYRVFVAEHSGDSRGQEWYTEIVALAVNPTTKEVVGHG